jgi:hypothetical protein
VSYIYSDPKREEDVHALPNVETFYVGAGSEPPNARPRRASRTAYELAHILTRGHGHDHVWRHVFRLLCEQAYGVRPRVENRFIGEGSRRMREASGDGPIEMPGVKISVLEGLIVQASDIAKENVDARGCDHCKRIWSLLAAVTEGES